ncbi:fasciclin domain-containing protein [Galbibacter sp. PAP.153]|uniref:fasciclin domain-containing protein n=1 Tax=Galbibacter sp. PAP.153 TaxID=3104623 RepID=UPI003009F356
MNKQNLPLKAIMLLLIFSCSLIACSNSSSEDNPETELPEESVSLYTYLKNDSNYSILVEAINQIGYQDALNVDGAGSYTFFAPNNEAFTKYLEANKINSVINIPTNTLTQIILNHMLLGKEKMINAIAEGYNKTQAKEFSSQANIDLFVSKPNDAFIINDGILVTKADIEVTNGVIHEVDAVIKPNTLATFIKVDPAFTNLYDASQAINSDIYTKLNDPTADLTLFVPNEAAFLAMGTITVEELEETVKYHVLDGNVFSASKFQDNGELKTWQGTNITTNTGSNVTITDNIGGKATMAKTDYVAWNGIAHVIDKVLEYE